MKITIPEQHREHFQENVAYITWWKKPTLLLMNRKENKWFQNELENAWICCKDGCRRGFQRPVVKLSIKNEIIDIPIPDDPSRQLKGKNRVFTKAKAGFVLS